MQAGIAKGGGLDQVVIADKPRPRIGMGKKPGQFFVKFHILADNGRDRRRHGFGGIAFGHERFKPGLGSLALDKYYPHRFAIGAGWPHNGQIPCLVQKGGINLFILPAIVGAGLVKKGVKGVLINHGDGFPATWHKQ